MSRGQRKTKEKIWLSQQNLFLAHMFLRGVYLTQQFKCLNRVINFLLYLLLPNMNEISLNLIQTQLKDSPNNFTHEGQFTCLKENTQFVQKTCIKYSVTLCGAF